ncbi:MAG: Mur ligase family protein, partial [Candidatus Methanomethyliaceae archaeon]|nr:Mur ligase family protein [Candidatus Methanomethyliaceae archaeon]
MLVIDATHGGITLSEALYNRGYDVVCVDVHRTVKNPPSKFQMLKQLPNIYDYDLIIRPIHYPLNVPYDFHGKVITHHEAVKMLISDVVDFPIVEITGSFGKTTAIKCAIYIMKEQFKILSLTSEGIFFIDHGKEVPLLKNISITPANIIKAIEICPNKPDLAIFEVSLGGTGMADLGIIKNVYHNYPIAKGTSSALEAKLSMIRNRKSSAIILLNADDPLLRNFSNVKYFSTNSNNYNICIENFIMNKEGMKFNVSFKDFVLEDIKIMVEAIGPVGKHHLENMLVGIAIARFFGIDERRIEFTRDPFDEKMAIVDPNIPLVVNRSASLNELVIN